MRSEKSLTDRLHLPAELMPGEPRITLCGSQVLIENHGGIQTYTGECIEVRSRAGLVRISGDGLLLSAMTLTEIAVRGLILSVELC